MGLYDRIVVPTDGSAASRPAIEHAVELAAVHDAEIHALYVINLASLSGVPTEGSMEGISEALEQEGETALEMVTEAAAIRDVPVEQVRLEGRPSQQIVAYATDHDGDLIVMGTHGRGGLDRLLLGSVAERVVRSATVPVLTVQDAGAEFSD
ncbi:universal stress protein UspA [Halodesulfurarchaeum formicicum]|uniref:Universal stress protein UspA n=1 Tax=Halodesulfurarchaeum formicicum TaxID=1873524 RepID=A0A1D8S2Z7_9EURY|nr:universal stress protein [Halodesulfurarchaeum formicicum]AOW79727.1 universal stress protein UspA [Halodesulfurarchaeum formicicum]APE94978.1 universal stress protein UspA [Halodesulfurarchaeum formicicum]